MTTRLKSELVERLAPAEKHYKPLREKYLEGLVERRCQHCYAPLYIEVLYSSVSVRSLLLTDELCVNCSFPKQL